MTENGSRLAEELAAQGKTQRWLANKLGVEPSVVNRWTTGRHTPIGVYRREIAKALKVGEGRIWPN